MFVSFIILNVIVVVGLCTTMLYICSYTCWFVSFNILLFLCMIMLYNHFFDKYKLYPNSFLCIMVCV